MKITHRCEIENNIYHSYEHTLCIYCTHQCIKRRLSSVVGGVGWGGGAGLQWLNTDWLHGQFLPEMNTRTAKITDAADDICG